MIDDPVTLNEWYVVATSEAVYDGKMIATQLLEEDIIIWRADGKLQAWQDRCPHRGSALSLGEVRNGDTVVCPYHGWHFDTSGQCTLMPAHPKQKPSGRACVKTYHVQEKYGFIWVNLGQAEKDVPVFHGVDDDYHLVINGPYDVETSGPRAVENFLDLSHFPFVHTGYLGEEPYTEVSDFDVTVSETEILVSNARAYQPRANAASTEGIKVGYSYRVLRPLTVMLSKEAQEENEKPSDLIMLTVQPKGETTIRVWILMAMNYGHEHPDSYFSEFQDTIFYQDKAVLESQRPKCLPLNPTAELHQPADKSSNAYRRWLKDLGLNYGTC